MNAPLITLSASPHLALRRVLLWLLAPCTLLLASCTSLPAKLEQFDRLGITHAEITGKWSHTTYHREEKDGVITSRLEHSNAWIPRAIIVRERKAEEKADPQ